MAKILLIDDDESLVYGLKRLMTKEGHEVTEAHDYTQGLALAESGSPEVIYLDVGLPDGNGLNAIPTLRNLASQPEIIIITGMGDAAGAELAISSGAWDYIEKSASISKISHSLDRALQYHRARKSVSRSLLLTLKRKTIIGDSPPIQQCLEAVAQAAGSDASVLVTGETGTGKELFARAIHENSRRAQGGPLVTVDCAALPPSLAEGLLFGHRKGVFTGAYRDREGLIPSAHGGTLFLDEVGELSLDLQKVFLRVLQEKKVRPVGGVEEVECNFRLVAATNRDLQQMADSGTFRSDLLFRLRNFVVTLPPLRQRSSDIRQLAEYCIDRYCTAHDIQTKRCFPELFELLEAYSWPGNVRELMNAMEQALAVAHHEPFLFSQNLPDNIRVEVMRSRFGRSTPVQSCEPLVQRKPGAPLPTLKCYREAAIAAAELQYLRELMQQSAGRIDRACRISGLSQSRLYALLKQYNITISRQP